jgi:alpha-beta hydrolase superfamily lysophospholipase
MKALKFVFITLACFFGVIYLIVVTYIYFAQESLIFQPIKLDKDYKFNYTQKFEEVNIPSTDNTNLNGLLFKAEHPKGLVFYLHGNYGALDSWGNIASNYTDLNYDIFILDYRGFGKSNGSISSEEQFYEDVQAAYNKVKSRYPENQIIIAGYSIGTGPAAYLASKNHPKALLLLAPYYNLTALGDNQFPFVPHFLLKYKFETNAFIQKVTAPIYIFHGNKDQVIPHENSERLSKLLKHSDHFFTLEDEDHIGIDGNEDYKAELKNILQ